MENLKQGTTNMRKYEVIYVVNSDCSGIKNPKFEVVQEFSANDDYEAASFMKNYNTEHPGRLYYWRYKKNRIGIWHEDGVCSYRDGIGHGFWDDAEEVFISRIAKWRKKYNAIKYNTDVPQAIRWEMMRKPVKRIARIRWMWGKKPIRFLVGSCIWLKDEMEYYLWDKWVMKIKDFKFNRRNVRNFKRTGHAISEHWGLGEHLLGDLKYNLKKILENANGGSFQFVEEVVISEHRDDKDFDFGEWYIANYNIPNEIIEKANKRRVEVFNHIIDLIDMAVFYGLPGPESEKEYPEIVLEGSYDELDFKKMNEVSHKCWNEIWDLVKKYGQSMWD